MKKNIACPVCNGRGFVNWVNSTEDICSTGSKTCPHCDGTGVREVSMTNIDRIRSMTDEELCKFLGECKFCDICEEGCDSCTYNGDCDKRLLDWLQQPVEVE